MSKYFKLVNPYVIGSMNTSFNADTSLEAAKLAYDNLSQYFGNHMPTFRFTLEKMPKKEGWSKQNFVHFEVNEQKGKDNMVKYEITEIDNAQDMKKFKKSLARLSNQDNKNKDEKTGGKRKYVSSDEDDDYFDSELERPRKGPLIYEPIVYYYYDPFLYPYVDRWYVPTFVLPLQPRVVFDSHSLLYLGR